MHSRELDHILDQVLEAQTFGIDEDAVPLYLGVAGYPAVREVFSRRSNDRESGVRSSWETQATNSILRSLSSVARRAETVSKTMLVARRNRTPEPRARFQFLALPTTASREPSR